LRRQPGPKDALAVVVKDVLAAGEVEVDGSRGASVKVRMPRVGGSDCMAALLAEKGHLPRADLGVKRQVKRGG
jgi:hypothetical protein